MPPGSANPRSAPRWQERFHAPTITFPAWSRTAPDRLAYTSDESGSYQAHAWDVTTGDRRRITDEAVGVVEATVTGDGEAVVWFRDETGDESGRWVATAFDGRSERDLLPEAPNGWPEGISLGQRIVVVSLADRSGFALYVSEEGGPAKELARDVDAISIGQNDYAIEGFQRSGISADESLICAQFAQDGDNIHQMLRVLDPRTGAVAAEMADGAGLGLYAYAWSPIPGDQRIAIMHERADMHRPAIWNPVTGERTDLDVDLPGEIIPCDWWPDGSALLIASFYRGRGQLYRYDIATGSVTEIRHPSGEIAGVGVRPDGHVWLRMSAGHQASRLLDEDGRDVLIPEHEGLRDGRPSRSWTFRNPAGDTVHGFLVTPPGDGPFPIYMKVHGGPSWLYCDTWMPEVQMLVDHGIAVALVNYRGSTGYGTKWRDHIIRNIGFPEVEDTVAGLDDLIARGIADPDRAMIGGFSWGGYVTLMAAGLRPERWRCAVAGVPVGDYMESYDDSAPSLQAYDRSLLGGVVHDIPEYVATISPLSYVQNVKTPILFLIGEHDTRCVPEQAWNYVNALRENGGQAEVYTYGTGHSSYVVEEEVRQYGAILEFVLRHLDMA